jgi:hypothetical protein
MSNLHKAKKGNLTENQKWFLDLCHTCNKRGSKNSKNKQIFSSSRN